VQLVGQAELDKETSNATVKNKINVLHILFSCNIRVNAYIKSFTNIIKLQNILKLNQLKTLTSF